MAEHWCQRRFASIVKIKWKQKQSSSWWLCISPRKVHQKSYGEIGISYEQTVQDAGKTWILDAQNLTLIPIILQKVHKDR